MIDMNQGIAEARRMSLKYNLDPDNWSHNHEYGPVHYHEDFEDAHVDVFLLTPQENP